MRYDYPLAIRRSTSALGVFSWTRPRIPTPGGRAEYLGMS
jgi:hypothetical protein